MGFPERIARLRGRRMAFLPVALLTLSGCLESLIFPDPVSPLSNSDNLRPSQLRVNLDVVKLRMEPSGTVKAFMEARFYDRQDRRVGLKHGRVLVNGEEMKRDSAWPFREAYYRLSGNSVTFGHDSLYVFEIVLDTTSGIAYPCSVRTQPGDMLQSERKHVGRSVHFTWTGDTTLPVRLKYTMYRDSDGKSKSVTRTYKPPLSQPLKITPDRGYEVTFHRLESVAQGKVHPAFRKGSIESMVRLEN